MQILYKNHRNDFSLARFWPTFFIILFLCGHTESIDYVAYPLLTALLIWNIKSNNFLLSYIPLIFFEGALNLPIKGSSFFMVYQILFIVHLILNINKFQISYKKIAPSLLGAAFFLLVSFIDFSIVSVFSAAINLIIILLIIIKINQNKPSMSFEVLLLITSISSLLSGVYGLFFIKPISYGYAERFSAIIGDPNYSAFFYTIGIFSALGSKLIKKSGQYLIIAGLFILMLLTLSLSGIFGTIFLLFLYSVFRFGILHTFKKLSIMLIICLPVALFLSNKDDVAIVIRISNALSSSDVNEISSNRYEFAQLYLNEFFNGNTFEILFGGKNVLSGEYSDILKSKIGGVSHNSFIDIIYWTGLIGLIAIIIIYSISIRNKLRIFISTKNHTFLSIVFIKLTMLYYSASLSLFPFRYYYTFLLL